MKKGQPVKSRHVTIRDYFARKRRQACSVALIATTFTLIFLIIALAAPSIHHSMVIFPINISIWWDVSLWRIYLRSTCDMPFLDAFMDKSNQSYIQICKQLINELNGSWIQDAAQKTCSFLPAALFSFHGWCDTLTSIALASIIVIALFLTSIILHLLNVVFLSLFASSIPIQTLRKGILALSFSTTILVVSATVGYGLFANPINQHSMGLNVLALTGGVNMLQGQTSLSTGYGVLVLCCVIHLLLCVCNVRFIRMEYCEDSTTQIQYDVLRQWRKKAGVDKSFDLLSIPSSVMDSDEVLEPIILDEDTAQQEARYVTKKYLENFIRGV